MLFFCCGDWFVYETHHRAMVYHAMVRIEPAGKYLVSTLWFWDCFHGSNYYASSDPVARDIEKQPVL